MKGWDPGCLRKGLEPIRPLLFFPTPNEAGRGEAGGKAETSNRLSQWCHPEGSLCLDQDTALTRLTSPVTVGRKEARGAVWFP